MVAAVAAIVEDAATEPRLPGQIAHGQAAQGQGAGSGQLAPAAFSLRQTRAQHRVQRGAVSALNVPPNKNPAGWGQRLFGKACRLNATAMA